VRIPIARKGTVDICQVTPAVPLLLLFFIRFGQQPGQGSVPRYLCPLLHVFQPPRFAFGIANSFPSKAYARFFLDAVRRIPAHSSDNPM